MLKLLKLSLKLNLSLSHKAFHQTNLSKSSKQTKSQRYSIRYDRVVSFSSTQLSSRKETAKFQVSTSCSKRSSIDLSTITNTYYKTNCYYVGKIRKHMPRKSTTQHLTIKYQSYYRCTHLTLLLPTVQIN